LLGYAYNNYLGRPSEEDTKLDLDINSRLSEEEEGEDEEDEIESIKGIIKIRSKEKSSPESSNKRDSVSN
jgi:hypothetical protein